jgi:hypothetical protein
MRNYRYLDNSEWSARDVPLKPDPSENELKICSLKHFISKESGMQKEVLWRLRIVLRSYAQLKIGFFSLLF